MPISKGRKVTKRSMKFCKWCNQDIDRPAENVEERMQAIPLQMGKEISYAILDGRMRSIDLCNWDYALLKMYRYSLEPKKILTGQEKAEYAKRFMRIAKPRPKP